MPRLVSALANSSPMVAAGGKVHFYAIRPHRAIVAVNRTIFGQTQPSTRVLSGKFEYIIGTHRNSSEVGYTAARNIGYRHRRLSLLARVPNTTPADLTWQQFLADAPTETDEAQDICYPWHTLGSNTRVEISIPSAVLGQFYLEANERGHSNISGLILEWAERNLETA